VLKSFSPQLLDVLLANLAPPEAQELAEILEIEENQHLWDLMGRREASFEAGPLLWLTKFTQTEDQHWMAKGTPAVAPFPTKSYLSVVMQYLLSEPTIFIPKSREMMTSWLVCGYISWMCQWFPHMFWVVQTDKEDKVVSLVNYCRILWRYQPGWMQKKCPLVTDNTTELSYGNGSRIIGVPKGENQVRLYHPYGYVSDESAFQPEFRECFNAVRPVTKQIIAVSSDEMGPFHDECKLIG
jgi:hypothetical protein